MGSNAFGRSDRGFTRVLRTGAKEDWRSKLFTVFVDNLSFRVAKPALREVFNVYGKVCDLYIPVNGGIRKGRTSNFSFIRYFYEDEMWKAIEGGNNRKIDGRFITVRKATTSWKERNLYKKKSSQRPEVDPLGATIQTIMATRDFRSYKEALIGAPMAVVGSQQKKTDDSSCSSSSK
ncbi:hypothetical protein REPUB_Repub05bG0055200 [Reevesia pubescens]